MGATLWWHHTSWHPDAAKALDALQTRFVAETYDLQELLSKHIASARAAVAWTEQDDPYDLLDFYRSHLNSLLRLSEQPIPDNPAGQIEFIREIYSSDGDPVDNVLDVIGLSEQREEFKAQPLSEEEMLRLVGTTRPSRSQTDEAVSEIHNDLGRGDCVCFPFYDGDDPAGWCFVGNTVD